jgi:putative transposase
MHDQTCSIDIMIEGLGNCPMFRTFNVVNDFNLESLNNMLGFSFKISRVGWILNHLVSKRGKPQRIGIGYGPEFVATLMEEWSQAQGIAFSYIEPGKPTQKTFVERFNYTYRRHVLDAYLFITWRR